MAVKIINGFYGKSELALMYRIHVNTLMKKFKEVVPQEAIEKAKYKYTDHSISPVLVEILFKHLGNPTIQNQ